MLMGFGQYSTDTGLNTPLDTSALQITPTFVGPCPTPGQIMNPQTGVCTTTTTPTPYVPPAASSGGSCDTGYAPCTATDGITPICCMLVANCPAGSTCDLIPGIPDMNIYLGIGAVVAIFALTSIFGGGHR